jgi:hypothetical protein
LRGREGGTDWGRMEGASTSWVPCLPCCLELWAGPCCESPEWLVEPNFTQYRQATKHGQNSSLPFSLSRPLQLLVHAQQGLPLLVPWVIPHLVGPDGFSWRGACALFCSQSPPPPSAHCPVPWAQCQRGCQPCSALPCPAWPMPCPCQARALFCDGPTWKVPALPPLPSDPTQSVWSSHAAASSLFGCRLPVSSHHHIHNHHHHLSVSLPAFFLSPASPSPHPQLWFNSSGKSSRGFLLGLDRPLL